MLYYNVLGAYRSGHPKKKTMDNINNNIKSLKINAELAFDEHKFRKATQYLLNVSNPR